MQRNHQVKSLLLVVHLLLLAQSLACSPEVAIDSPTLPTMTSTQAPPEATFTPESPTLTPTQPPPTDTSTPAYTDTPTAVPTSTFIPGSDTPFMVAGLELQILGAGLGEHYKGFVPSNMTSGQVVLWVDIDVLSGSMDDLIALEEWVEDENGSKMEVGAGLSTGSVATYLFAVPETSTSFVLHFSSGEAVDLTPILQ